MTISFKDSAIFIDDADTGLTVFQGLNYTKLVLKRDGQRPVDFNVQDKYYDLASRGSFNSVGRDQFEVDVRGLCDMIAIADAYNAGAELQAAWDDRLGAGNYMLTLWGNVDDTYIEQVLRVAAQIKE